MRALFVCAFACVLTHSLLASCAAPTRYAIPAARQSQELRQCLAIEHGVCCGYYTSGCHIMCWRNGNPDPIVDQPCGNSATEAPGERL